MIKHNKISQNINQLYLKENNLGNSVEWINISNPRKNEIEFLRKNFDFDLAHLRSSSSVTKNQRPIVEQTDKYLFVILHFPILENDIVKSKEIDFFIGDNYIVTLHNNIKIINDFFNFCKKNGLDTLNQKHFSTQLILCDIIEKIILNAYNILDINVDTIELLEDSIFSQINNKTVSDILFLRRNILNTSKALQNHKNVIQNLISIEHETKKRKEISDYYNKLLTNSKKIWETLNSQKEMVEILHDTNESLLNHKLNEIMKTLTIFSVIVLPLNLLAGVFGMNAIESMPFVNDSYGFWYIMLLMFLSFSGMLIYFKKRRWI